jgi:hypothetical protein
MTRQMGVTVVAAGCRLLRQTPMQSWQSGPVHLPLPAMRAADKILKRG